MREAGSADEGLDVARRGAAGSDPARRDDARVDGWEMLRHVQEKHGVGTIPVIMFSGKVDERSAATRRLAARRGSSASRSTRVR